MFKKALLLAAGITLGAPVMAAISAADAAKLGAELTPLGGEKAANSDGSIPAWDGGLTSASQAGFANFRPGSHHPDPYASDKPLYTVTPANMGQYANKLSEGHKKLLQTYRNTFKMVVYPTHRSAAAPQRIYDATKRIATTAESPRVVMASPRRARAFPSRFRKRAWKSSGTTCCVTAVTSSCAPSARRR